MNRKRDQSSKNKKSIKNNKIIRCRKKMIPVFISDTCEDFIKKDRTESGNMCQNCRYSF